MSSCERGSRTYEVYGTIRNPGSTTLTDVKAYIAFELARGFAVVDDSTLAPGQTTGFRQVLSYSVASDSACPDTSPRAYEVNAWGTIAP